MLPDSNVKKCARKQGFFHAWILKQSYENQTSPETDNHISIIIQGVAHLNIYSVHVIMRDELGKGKIVIQHLDK